MTPAGVLTVADLLSRNAPVPVKIAVDDTTTGVSVGSLLRREGRAPHALDRPVQPRAHQQADEPAEKPSDRRVLVRRGALAAGTLLAAGSVFGAAVLTDIAPTGSDAQGDTQNGTYPGQGLLDPNSPVITPPGAAVIDQAAVIDPLDPGMAAPSSWVPIAFPSALAGVPAGTAAAAEAPGATDVGGSGTGSTDQGSPSGTGGSSGNGGGGGSDTSTQPSGGGGSSHESSGPVGDLGNGLGDTVENVGSAVPGGLGDTVEGVGGAVKDTGSTLDGVTGSLLSSDANDSQSSSSASSSRTSAPQQADEGSESSDGGSGQSSGGLLGGVGKVAANLLGS